VVDFVNILKA